jgi:DNA-binding CsgD family transcriptional regulator
MAAAGVSNRDIAQTLFVSLRTVETHLTHSYAKLSINGRSELVAAIARESTGLQSLQ